jgi:NAD(P)-dependent dehydrogenase (short-subunit alcohol dehydrogenase family)
LHTFTQAIIDQGTPRAIVNTGSKQGITCPPGDPAYNITKAGVKVLTEGLAHALRNIAGCQVTAHLLVPGSTFTGNQDIQTRLAAFKGDTTALKWLVGVSLAARPRRHSNRYRSDRLSQRHQIRRRKEPQFPA